MKHFSTFSTIGLLITPFAWYFSYLSLGAGHGEQFVFRILYPLPFLFVFQKAGGLFVMLTSLVGLFFLLLQFSVYGYLIDYTIKKKPLVTIGLILLFHFTCLSFTFLE